MGSIRTLTQGELPPLEHSSRRDGGVPACPSHHLPSPPRLQAWPAGAGIHPGLGLALPCIPDVSAQNGSGRAGENQPPELILALEFLGLMSRVWSRAGIMEQDSPPFPCPGSSREPHALTWGCFRGVPASRFLEGLEECLLLEGGKLRHFRTVMLRSYGTTRSWESPGGTSLMGKPSPHLPTASPSQLMDVGCGMRDVGCGMP